jgi:DNA-binding CsgD family transcriptional regulator
VLQRLAELQLDRAEPILPFARCLLGSGATGSTVASVLETAAREVVADDPGLAAELFGAAVSAGRPLSAVVTEWARAAALAGDLDTALRLADQAILGRNPAGARVAGAAMAHRGQWARSAELYGWAGDSPFAQIASIAVGSDATVPVARAGGLPTALDGAAGLMAEGVRLSVCGSPVGALSMLVQASALLEPAGRDALLPDSPAAVAALVALHCGQLDVAESVVDGAVAGRMGGDVMRNRHTLLLAWIRMVRGRLGAAAELVDGLDIVEPRDRLFLVALEVGLARRAGDTVALRRTWTHAGECLVRHPVDLFTFLPLSEFIVAAARLRDPGRLGTAVADAFALLKRLGDPALWSAPLHWAGVQAAIITESSAATHIQALAANRTPYGAALTEAARCWVDVTASKVEPDRVQAAAVALLEAGLWWDSARLASEAAIRTSDRKAMVGLLDCARQLQAKQQQIRQPVHRPLIAQQATSPLSEREREVADLVVQGLTYKQIGDKLFISAKTVEHHMARIRHRLGAGNRSELITQLRALSGQ